jgi:hypothetical protein
MCAPCYAQVDIVAAQQHATLAGSAALVGAMANAVPPLLHLTSARLYGDIVSAGYSHYVAIGCGGVAAACGIATILNVRPHVHRGWLVIGALVLAIAGYHVAWGSGVVS